MPENLFVSPIQNQASGFASPAESEREPPLDLSRQLIAHPAATFMLRARGSWPELGIRTGDLLLVDRAWEPAPGLLALGIRDGSFCLGRLQRTAWGWRLGSSATGPAQLDDEIWGVICHVIRQLV
ncbi:MAG: LexA family protein [Candidatus Sericytochromatia bacterium]